MLGYRMKPIRKACSDILKTFCDKNTNSFNKKLFTRDSHSLPYSNFCLLDRNYIYSLGSKNLKYSSSVYRRLHCFTKSQVRWYSAQQAAGLPQLTSLSQEVWPGIIAPFSNLFLSYLVIRPFVDGTFDLREFVTASKQDLFEDDISRIQSLDGIIRDIVQVVEIVSRKMASNDIDGLGEMMNAETFGQIKQNLPRFSADQRQELATDQNDIYFTSPAAMNFVNDRETDKKFLEITMIYHALRGYKNLNFESFNPFQNMQNPQQFQSGQAQNPLQHMKLNEDKAYFLNYKFIREYSAGMASDWLLSGLNHYKKSQIVVPGLF